MLSFFLSLLLSALSSVSFACVFRLSPSSVSLVYVFRCLLQLSPSSVPQVCLFRLSRSIVSIVCRFCLLLSSFPFTFEFCFPHFGCPLCLLSFILGPLLCFIRPSFRL
ncbi:hypothetical protein J3E68DRAFT_331165 [Trichoderma sp. SZMC 28012]